MSASHTKVSNINRQTFGNEEVYIFLDEFCLLFPGSCRLTMVTAGGAGELAKKTGEE